MQKIRNNLFLILLVSICTLFFTVSKPNNEARAEDYATLQISSFSFVGNESGNTAIGLYRISLESPLKSAVGVVFATPNTVVQKADGNSAADIRGEGVDSSLIVRVPYGRVQVGATSINDLADNTKIVIKAGVDFTLDGVSYTFAEDYELIYTAGSGCFMPYVEPTELSISGIEYLGDEGANIALYRIVLANPMPSNADVTFATPNVIVQKEDGNSAADIRGENVNSSLVLRIPYGRIIPGAQSVADVPEGTTITIKAQKSFALSNGTFCFAEDIKLALFRTDNLFHIINEPTEAKEISVTKTELINISDNPLAFDYHIYLSQEVQSDEVYSVCKNLYENAKAILVNAHGEFAGYLMSTEESNCILLRVYVSTLSEQGTLDSIPDGYALKLQEGQLLSFDGSDYFKFDNDIELYYNKQATTFCITQKNEEDKYVVYDADTEDWVVLEPQILVKVNDRVVENDVIIAPSGPSKDVLSIVAYDAVSSNITPSYTIPVEALDGNDNFVVGEYQFTVTAVDALGIQTQKTYTLQVVDGTAPVVTLVSFTATYNQGDELVYEATVSDNIDNLTVEDIQVKYPENSYDENGLLPGVWTIQLFVVDSNLNVGYSEEFVVTVKDTEAPVITVTGETNYEAGIAYTDGSILSLVISISDNVDGEITSYTLEIPEGMVANNKLAVGSWELVIKAKDEALNEAEQVVTIVVTDTLAPVITVDVNNKIIYNEHETPNFTITAEDQNDGAITINFVYPEGCLDSDGKLLMGSGTWTVTAEAVDKAGNKATESFNIFVEAVDSTKPVITITGATEYNEGDTLGLVVLANDETDGNLVVDVTKPNGMEDGNGKLVKGTWTITYSATDASGNTETVTKTITVKGAEEEKGCMGSVDGSAILLLCIGLSYIGIKRKR